MVTFRTLVFTLLAVISGSALAQGTLRIGWAGSPDSLNPGAAILTEAYTLFELVYDTMYNLELDGTFSLELAESAEVSEDDLTWTFTLRDGVTFHDGEPLTAEDVAFTYTLVMAHDDFPYLNSYTEHFASVEAPDERTVVITLDEPIPNMEAQLVFLYVLPEHIWAEHAETAVDFENLEMVGSGPFALAEYQQSEFVRLTANKEHFAAPPKVDEVIFQTFGSQDVLVQAIRTGQVDMITEMPTTAVAALRNDPNIELVTGAPLSPSVTDVILNQVSPENCPVDEGGVCSGHPALQDRAVRLALAHATNKQEIIDVVLLGLGTPGLTLIPDGLGVWFNDSLEDYAYDIEAANALLDEAGYLDTDGDGVREMPDGGRDLTFRLNWPSDKIEGPRTAELLSSMWSQIGVGTELQAVDPDALTALCCPAFDYDVMVWGWGSDTDPNLLLSVMTTGEIPTGTNESGYSNPDFDALFEEQAVTLDSDLRHELVWRMQQIAFDDVAYIIPFYEQAVQAYRRDRFTGWLTGEAKVALEDPTSLTVIEPVQ